MQQSTSGNNKPTETRAAKKLATTNKAIMINQQQ